MNKDRYVGRKEFFGSLLFDRKTNEYIPFNMDETSFFMKGKFREPVNRYEMRCFTKFEALCKDMEVLDRNGKFQHRWIDNCTQDKVLSAPLKLSLNITSGCNLRCRHCYAVAQSKEQKGMEPEKFKILIDEMAQLGILSLSVKGGEPFSHPSLMDSLAYAEQKGICVTIITNGLLIDEDIAQRLNNTSVSYITLSLDGAQEKTHNYIRGEGTFTEVLDRVKMLKKYFHHPVYLYFTLNKLNIYEIPQMFSLAQEVKCDGLRFRPVLPIGRASEYEDINLTPAEYQEAIGRINDIAKQGNIKVDLPYADLPEGSNNTVLNPGLYSFGCIGGNTFVHMDEKGNLYPCQYLESPEFSAGNIFSSSLKSIWDTSSVFKTFRNLPGNPTCGACKFFSNCRGGCRARAIKLCTDINCPDPWCKMTAANSSR